MNKIEFGELRIGDVAKAHIQDCLQTNWVSMGPKVKLFEQKFAALLEAKHCRLLSSGTAADTAACMALYEVANAKAGDEVIVPALSFIATANSVRAAGLTPKFVDIKRETLNIDESKIEAVIGPRTKAIMAVNLMGRPAELDVIRNICDKHNLILIVDNCEGYGARFKGKLSIEYADFETTSHFMAHMCMVGGEGGCVLTNNSEYDKIIEGIRSHGRMGGSLTFHHPIWGLNFKNTDLHACVGLEQVDDFKENFEIRRNNLNYLLKRVKEEGLDEILLFNKEDDGNINAPHGFTITPNCGMNDYLTDCLKKSFDHSNISWKLNFLSSPTQHRCFEYLGHKLGEFPEAEFIGTYGVHVGVHRFLSTEDLDRIVRAIWDACYSPEYHPGIGE